MTDKPDEKKSYNLVNIELGEVNKLVSKVYDDLASYSIKPIGKTIGTLLSFVNTLLLPVDFINSRTEIFKKNIRKYSERIESIPEGDLISVSPEIGVPILNKLEYVSNDEISNLFINLLAKASSSKTVNQAHPSFIQMLDRVSVDEARMIKYLQGKSIIPFVNLKNYYAQDTGYNDYSGRLTAIEIDIELLFPDNLPIYLENLSTMRIIYTNKISKKYDDALFQNIVDKYLNSAKTQNYIKSKLHDTSKLLKGHFNISEFGRQFIEACNYKLTKQDEK